MRMEASSGYMASSRPSISSGLHPLRSASSTQERNGSESMRRGFLGSRRRRSAFLCAASAEWNGPEVHAPVFSRFGR
ncbi:Uncharacterised protein [Bifidobacterium longum subsp. infantis]|uniref:Uncharacterized protein n=1 Tax=Bifidobacterium longum subsp. infantis TaxID=1682 RepID=A0A564S1B2_BIFLI|nr:Uncharacterised protein [Bifidobacterium longum subsp. infantis]